MIAHRRWVRVAGLISAALVLAGAGCGSNPGGPGFEQTNLVSNTAGNAPVEDPNLLNPWGLTRSPTGPWFVADNQAGVATSYDGVGNRLPPGNPIAITIPPPANSPPGTQSLPSGIVFNDTNAFDVVFEDIFAPAQYIFATEDGTIAAWNPIVAPTAVLAVDNSAAGALYKGLALGSSASGPLLYATNFRAQTIDVFDGTFSPVILSGAFEDSGIPTTFAPYGIQNIDGNLFVTYAKRSANDEDDVPGVGNGYVDVFDTDGEFVRRFATQGQLNSPWAVVEAPISFGRFGGAIIIGNFGDGNLNAFNPVGGTFLGKMSRPNGDPIEIPGLWGLGFGNGSTAGSSNSLYFVAGPNREQDGLFGTLDPSPQ